MSKNRTNEDLKQELDSWLKLFKGESVFLLIDYDTDMQYVLVMESELDKIKDSKEKLKRLGEAKIVFNGNRIDIDEKVYRVYLPAHLQYVDEL